MEYYNSFHSISEFLKQGRGHLLVDSQRLYKARHGAAAGKKSRLLQLLELAASNAVSVEERSPHELQNLLQAKHYRGYILAIESTESFGDLGSKADILRYKPKLLLLLDGVLDVGNLGAIVRSADLFGVAAVFVAPHSAGLEQLGRAAAGANAWVPIIEGNLAQTARQLKEGGYWLYAADIDKGSELAPLLKFQSPCALVLGAEEHGISKQLHKLCDTSVQIPTEGHLDSLNVAAAGAVLLYEIKRQWCYGRQNPPVKPAY